MTPNDTIESGDSSLGGLINHLPIILWQRRYYVLIPFLALLAAGIIAAFLMPTVYRSNATLLVEAQDLPSSLVESPLTGAIDQRIARIRQHVLSRGDLIAVIEQNDLYPDERRSEPMSKVIEKMRHSTSVSALAGNIGQQSGTQNNTIAIGMSFDYPDPAKAQAVLQSFVTKFLVMDAQNVEDQASLSVRFLEDQANKLQAQIRVIEGDLTGLKARNGAALASSGAAPFIDTGSYSAQITALQTENRQLIAQARRPQARTGALANAEAALTDAMARFSDSHPDVAQARERVEQLRRTAQVVPEDTAPIQEQVAANNAAIQSMIAQRNATVARAQSSMAGQARAPAILEQAMQLESRAGTLRSQYQQISENLLKAQNSLRMTSERRSEHLTLVEPASLPDQPASPNRPLIIALGAMAGLGLGLLLALALELLFRPIRSPRQLEQMQLPIMGIVPLIRNKKPSRRWSLRPWREKQVAA